MKCVTVGLERAPPVRAGLPKWGCRSGWDRAGRDRAGAGTGPGRGCRSGWDRARETGPGRGIVLAKNPLEDVRHSESVVYTMVNGRLYDAKTLAQIAPERVELPDGPDLETIRGDAAHAHCACGR